MYSTRQSETFLISTSSSTCPSWWRPPWSSPRTCSLLLELTGLDDVGQPRWPFSFVVSLWWFVLLSKVRPWGLLRTGNIKFEEYFSVQNPPSLCVSVGTVLRYVRHERGLPVHRGGDADLPERPGDRSGQCHVDVVPDGLALHCLLGMRVFCRLNTNDTILPVRPLRKSSISDHRPSLHPRSHPRPLPPGDCGAEDAGLSGRHRGGREVSCPNLNH